MATVMVWCRQVGSLPDGTPIIDKRPETDPQPDAAWLAEQDAEAWQQEIMDELMALDVKSVRALREGNAQRIAEIEARAEELRRFLGVIAWALSG